MSVDLGALVGALLAEVTRARLAADLEAARLADVYASDPLLRHMPVPRFRLPDVTIDLPVVVDDLEEGGGEPDLQVPSEAKRQKMVAAAQRYAGLGKQLDRGIVNDALNEASRRLRSGPGRILQGRRIVRELGRAAAAGLDRALEEGDDVPRVARQRFVEAIERAVRAEIAEQMPAKGRLRVGARTRDVKAAGDSSRVMQLRLTISEEAYEMTVGEEDGERVEYFGPE